MSERDDLLMPGEAAALIGVSTVSLRLYARLGQLEPAVHIPGQMRLYRRSDVEEFARKRREGGTGR